VLLTPFAQDFLRQLFTHFQAGFVHRNAVNGGIRARKVHIFKNAWAVCRLSSALLREHFAFFRNENRFARRNITLDWERMLTLEGNSAPYIQYMYARCRSIIRRVADEGLSAATQAPYDLALLTHPAETAVVKQLARLPGAVREAGARYAPFVIAEWCYEMARALAGFYRDCSVLKAETPELRAARLRLVAATAQALRNGMGLLGIKAPERM